MVQGPPDEGEECPALSILLMKGRGSARRDDEGCHPSDEGGRRHVESQMGRRESSSFVSVPAAASVAIKVCNKPAPRRHLRRDTERAHFTAPSSRAASRCCVFPMNVSCWDTNEKHIEYAHVPLYYVHLAGIRYLI